MSQSFSGGRGVMNSPGEKAQARLGALLRDFESLSQHQVGYPCNQNFDYSELLPFSEILRQQRRRPFSRQQFPQQHPRDRARSHRAFR